MTSLRLILAIVILLLAAFIVVMNWGYVIASIRNRIRGIDRRYSTVPLVSILLVMLASLIHPQPDQEKRWMLIVPLVDIGNWSLLGSLLWLPVALIRDARKK